MTRRAEKRRDGAPPPVQAPRPDRAAFARRWAGALIGFFTGCLFIALMRESVLFLLTALGGYLWIFLSFRQR
ncbi:MAG: hypothetical protein AAFT19_01640 [Pseudomonadota bacterium]